MNERSDVTGEFKPPERSDYLLGFEVQDDKVVHNSNYPRPATPEEMVLWQEYTRMKDDYLRSCKHAWEMYQAGTGKTIETFTGISISTVEDVREERNRLIQELTEARAVNEASKSQKS